MPPPNILFIVADDLNSWIEPLGRHPDVRTPSISSLASRSTVFSRAYCTAPYCNASRMSVFTGCLPSRNGIYQNEPFWQRPLRRTTFVEHFRAAGYYCCGAGKVFHGNFDYATAGRERAAKAPWKEVQNRREIWDEFHTNIADPMPPDRPLNRMFDFNQFDTLSSWNHLFDWGVLPADREAEMPDSITVDRVCEFLKNPPRQPFICAAGFYKPHLPWYVPQEFIDLYPIESISLPLVKNDDLDDVPDVPRAWVESRPDHENVLRHGQWRHAVQGYLAAISYCDRQIGTLMKALDASEVAENTIVVLWGDNGFHLGEKLHWRKFVLWEEATRVPLIIMPPRNAPALHPRVDEPVSLVDIWPTLCDMTGIPSLENIDGDTLLPLMRDDSSCSPRPAFMTWTKGNHSVRVKRWRYTRYSDGGEELYDHANDPYEWTNLAASRIDDLHSMREVLATKRLEN